MNRWQTILAIDADKWAAATYAANFPGVPVQCGFVANYIASLPSADVVIGGPSERRMGRVVRGHGKTSWWRGCSDDAHRRLPCCGEGEEQMSMNLTPREFAKVCGILAKRGQKVPELTQAKKVAATSPNVLSVRIPFDGMRVVNPLNNLKHWRKSGPERKAIRSTVYETLVYGHLLPELPIRVQVHRVGKQLMDEWDGLPASLKAVVDSVADAYGTRDSDPRITWLKPTQERGPYRVVVTIWHREGREAEVPQ